MKNYLSIFFLGVVIPLSTHTLLAQEVDAALAMVQKGDSLADNFQPQLAIKHYYDALRVYASQGKPKTYADLLLSTAYMHIILSEAKKADSLAKLAQVSMQQLPRQDTTLLANLNLIYGEINEFLDVFDTAWFYYHKNLRLCLLQFGEAHTHTRRAYNRLASLHYTTGQNDSAVYYLNAVLRTLHDRDPYDLELLIIKGNLSIMYTEMGKYDSAFLYLDEAIEVITTKHGPDINDLAYNYRNRADLYYQTGQYSKAISDYKESIRVDLIYKGENSERIANSYNNLANIYMLLGSTELAYEYLSKALSIQEEIYGSSKTIELAVTYNSLGKYWRRKEQYQKSLSYYHKALNCVRSAGGPNHPEIVPVYINFTTLFADLGHSDSLNYYLIKAEQLQRSIDQAPTKRLGLLLSQRAQEQFRSGLLPESYHTTQLAIEQYVQAVGSRHPELSMIYQELANRWLSQSDYDSALAAAQQALISNSAAFEDHDLMHNPKPDDWLNFLTQTTAFDVKGHVLWASYKQTDEEQYAQAVLALAETYDSLVVVGIDQTLSHRDKLTLSSGTQNLYYIAYLAATALYQASDDRLYLDKAFMLMEQSKAIVLRLELNDKKGRSFGGIPQIVMEKEMSLRNQQVNLRGRLLRAQNQQEAAQQAYYQNQLFAVNRQLDSISSYLKVNAPRYYKIKYDQHVLSLAELQEHIGPKQAVLQYLRQDSLLLLMAVSKKQVKTYQIELDTHFGKTLTEFNRQFRVGEQKALLEAEAYNQLAYALYQRLLEQPLDDLPIGVDKLTIVPPLTLATMPWEILVRSPSEQNFYSQPYLLRDYIVSYAYSSSLLFRPGFKKAFPKHGVLAFAPSYTAAGTPDYISLTKPFRNELVPLEWNESEAAGIGQLFGGMTVTGAEATERQFKQVASQYQVLHLAMHALVNHEESMRSRLVFSQEKDSTEDGLLHTFELYNMELNADLVVLSACNTGIGQLARGEGVMSLERAFSYAGVPSIVMSHWRVNDQAASQLMHTFYKHLSEGVSKDEALRQAKLSYLQHAPGATAHPFYWGSFVQLGDSRPLKLGGWSYWWWSLAALPLLLWWRRKRQ